MNAKVLLHLIHLIFPECLENGYYLLGLRTYGISRNSLQECMKNEECIRIRIFLLR